MYLALKIVLDLRQIGSQRMLNGLELGRVGRVVGRTRTGRDAQQSNHGRDGSGGSLNGSTISGASAHVVILYSPASIVAA